MKVKNALKQSLLYFSMVLVISILWVNIGFGAASSNYSLMTDVLSGGGGDMGSTNYDLLSTTGQPTAIGTSSSSNYADFAGFWYQVGEQGGVFIAPILELLLLD